MPAETRTAAPHTSPVAYVGDRIATRRNDRTLVTSTGQFVRNRDQWIVTAIDGHGDIAAANHVLVVTETHDLAEAREVLDHVITNDRADVPAITRRQQLRDDRLDAVFQRWIDDAPARPAPAQGRGIEME